MKKRWIPLLCALILLCSLLPTRAEAAVETDRSCSITLHYAKDGIPFPGLNIEIYRVASAAADGTYTLVDKYAGYPVRIHGITSQTEWDNAASTLLSYIAFGKIAPDKTAVTDKDGTAVFSGLKTGLYLVKGITAENNSGIYTFKEFFLYLPTPLADGSLDYDVEAYPKCVGFVPKTKYTVIKLWKDTGYGYKRPVSITVDILKDGIVQETIILNADNNWTYTWYVPDGQGKWTVVERDPPDGYTVTMSEKDGTITITNSYDTPTTDIPKTGDTFPLWPLVLAMGGSGLLLILLAIYRIRRKK